MKLFSDLSAQWRARLVPAQQWWQQREPRERLALSVLGVALGVTLVWMVLVQPLLAFHADARRDYLQQTRLLNWMEDNAPAIRQRQGQARPRPAAAGDWVAQLSRSATNGGVILRGFNPEGDNAVRIQIEGQPFDNVMIWLQYLEQEQGIVVSMAEFSATSNPGLINLRATLKRMP